MIDGLTCATETGLVCSAKQDGNRIEDFRRNCFQQRRHSLCNGSYANKAEDIRSKYNDIRTSGALSRQFPS